MICSKTDKRRGERGKGIKLSLKGKILANNINTFLLVLQDLGSVIQKAAVKIPPIQGDKSIH